MRNQNAAREQEDIDDDVRTDRAESKRGGAIAPRDERREKNQVLLRAAEYLVKDTEFILSANETDMENGREGGMKEGLLDRLKLTKERIEGMAEGLCQIAALPDPIGGVISEWTPENGLDIRKVRVPLGVIGIIYEARPNVTADAFGLCFKTGNPVVLRGGSDAVHSNLAIVEVLQKALTDCGCPASAIQLLEDRKSVV